MLMFSQFISYWIHLLFIVWIILYYKQYDVAKINIAYLLYLLCFGYLLYLIYHISRGVQYQLSFVIFNLITHIAPLIIFIKLGFLPNEYSGYVFMGVGLVYLLFLYCKDKNVIDIYLVEEQITNFDDVYTMCLTRDIITPTCSILRLLYSK